MTSRFVQLVAAGLLALGEPAAVTQTLGPTRHPALPRAASDLWFVPSARDRSGKAYPAAQALAEAVRLHEAGKHEAALAGLSAVGAGTPLGDYIDYYKGLAHLRLNRLQEAERSFAAILDREPQGAIGVAAALARGETAEAAGDHRTAVAIYARLAADKRLVSDDVLSRLGRSALAAGDRKTAAAAYARVYYEFALSTAATAAASHLASLRDQVVRTGYKGDLGRAAMLFGARRYAEARAAFQEVQKAASGDDRELAELRIAECDFYLKRYEAARDSLRPHLERGAREAEARYFYLSAIRELGKHDEYVAGTRALVNAFPADAWAEEALNSLGTHYILTNDDEAAARTFAELYEKFPTGSRAERAAWKSGWWRYKGGDHAQAITVFESAAAAFPRSDYRPSFLYWAARAHAKLGARTEAHSRFRLVQSDYGNSYYGRLARKFTGGRAGVGTARARSEVVSHQQLAEAPPRPPTEPRIRLLLASGLYDDALAELRYAQRQWGTSPALEATIAWAYHRKGDLRRAITLMRRAYPQSLGDGGDDLPVEMRQVLFPLVYWDLIRKHSAAHDLDPYVVAALIGQESTFEPDARSVANARGLMQILPATGRQLARAAGIRRFTTSSLGEPETNIRLGTLHFARLVRQFGGTYYALASYNAGENRIVRWKAERPGMDEDEFIDDIPFPETQNYVKRILGTAEDYRMLYGRDGGRPLSAASVRK